MCRGAAAYRKRAQRVEADRADLPAAEKLHRVAQDQRDPDRDEEKLQRARPLTSERLPHDDVGRDRKDRGRGDRHDRGSPERQSRRHAAHRSIGSEGQHVPVREIDQAKDAEDQRQADGAEGVVASGDKPGQRRLSHRVRSFGEHQGGGHDSERNSQPCRWSGEKLGRESKRRDASVPPLRATRAGCHSLASTCFTTAPLPP